MRQTYDESIGQDQSYLVKRGRETRRGKAKWDAQERRNHEWLLELLLPGLFIIVLLGCLAHLGYCALQSQLESAKVAHHAISAFAI